MNKKVLITLSILLFILGILFVLDLLKIISIPCIFYEYLHIYCPGCGTTRMIRSLLHLEIYQAFRYNPLAFMLLLALLGVILVELIYFIKRKKILNISNKIYVILLIIIILYWILRNIPYFSWLAPTVIK